ncbi:hypothetical protein [Actinoplanes aureus]|uniref:Uncharacterized protein n=1 Tax=Actinoplanes aureus TaxID=2792083 RepID=A0A931CD40_9ACTN|nr:hypothetical protein [Actinoplanes aureus]MBG0563943.1 hypothetical protein [Actinoplanes aureus]
MAGVVWISETATSASAVVDKAGLCGLAVREGCFNGREAALEHSRMIKQAEKADPAVPDGCHSSGAALGWPPRWAALGRAGLAAAWGLIARLPQRQLLERSLESLRGQGLVRPNVGVVWQPLIQH